jgi:hypothetical protein
VIIPEEVNTVAMEMVVKRLEALVRGRINHARQIQETALISDPKLAANPIPVTVMRILALMIVLSISVFIFSIRDQVQELAKFGYPRIFAFNFSKFHCSPSSSSILLCLLSGQF